MLGQDGHAAGADLVGEVAVGGDAVTAHEAGLHPAVFHHHGRHVVADEGHVHPRPLQLIAGEPRPLQKGAGLVGKHADVDAPLRRQQEGALSGAVPGGGQRTGIAVGQNAVAVLQQAQTVFGDGGAFGDVVLVDVHRLAVQSLQQFRPVILQVGLGGIQHLPHRPAEVHRRGPGRSQQFAVDLQFPVKGLVVLGVNVPGQRVHAVARADADGRRAPDAEHFDGLDHLLHGAQLDLFFLVGQQRLVDDVQPLRGLVIADVLNVGHLPDRFIHSLPSSHIQNAVLFPGLVPQDSLIRIA